MTEYKDMLRYMIPYIKATGVIGKELKKYEDAVKYSKALYDMSQSVPNAQDWRYFISIDTMPMLV